MFALRLVMLKHMHIDFHMYRAEILKKHHNYVQLTVTIM